MNAERIKEIEEKKLNKVLSRILMHKTDAEREKLKTTINVIIDATIQSDQ